MANAIIERVGGVGVDCDDATATTAQVLSGKTFGGSASDEIQTGAMSNQGKKTYTISTNNGSVNIPQGYHDGTGKVTYSLPSVNGGNTYTPTAAAQTISLSGKYLKSNITVAGSSNLVAGNILRGKNIWGVNGGFVNYGAVSQVYNGSAFDGWLTDGVLTNVKRIYVGNSTTNARDYVGMSNFVYDTHYRNDARNDAIRSGSLYANSSETPGGDGGLGYIGYERGFVSAKSINFSIYSTLRITGSCRCGATGYWNGGSGYIDTSIKVSPITITNGSAHIASSEIEKEQHTTGWNFTMTSEEYPPWKTYDSGVMTFDKSFDISSWKGTSDFLGILLETNYYFESNSWTRRSRNFTITGIYLS